MSMVIYCTVVSAIASVRGAMHAGIDARVHSEVDSTRARPCTLAKSIVHRAWLCVSWAKMSRSLEQPGRDGGFQQTCDSRLGESGKFSVVSHRYHLARRTGMSCTRLDLSNHMDAMA
ncbi:hypothetical protein BJX96DRAFT_141981 [Aspergillus floccosus]